MLNNLSADSILFLDIETVPQCPNYSYLDESWKTLWEAKAANLKKADHETASDIYNRAGIYAEFGKIICISCGFFKTEGSIRSFRVKSFYGDDERILLKEFAEMLERHFSAPHHLLCAHNGKEFDYPYICRRMIVNRVNIPSILNIAGKKPWEVQHLDTMELWKFGDFKSYTSLNLLAHTLGVPTPKDDIDGSMVYLVYYQDNDLERIATYCQKDVITTAQIFLRYRYERLLTPDDIIYS